jgi:hypothetical protein
MREEGKRVSGTAMVATQSRFHRDRLDGEPIVSKAIRFDLVPNFQVVTLAPLPLMVRVDGHRVANV